MQLPLGRQADSVCGGTRVLRGIRSRLWGLVIATIIPFTVLIGAGIGIRWRSDQATAIAQAISEARLLASQIDDHIGNLENLLTGLREAVSTDPRDVAANDALLRRVKGGLPDFYSHIALFAPDGTNIGTSSNTSAARADAKGHVYFEQALAGQDLTIGDVAFGTTAQRWLLSVARPIKDASGQVRAVLAVGTLLEHFQDALRIQSLPEGTIVTVLNEKGIVLARSVDGARWIGQNASSWPHLAKHFSEKEGSDVGSWSNVDGGERVTAFTTAHRAPWLVIIGLPKNAVFATGSRQCLAVRRSTLRKIALSCTLLYGHPEDNRFWSMVRMWCLGSTRCSTAWPISPTGCAVADGLATPGSEFGT